MRPALLLAAAVAEDRLHLDAGRHVHHAARLGDDALARIELDLDELQVLAVDRVADLVRALAKRPRARARPIGGGGIGGAPAAAPASCGTSPSGVQLVMPAVKTSVAREISPMRRRLTTSPSGIGPTCCPSIARYHCCPDTICSFMGGRALSGLAGS